MNNSSVYQDVPSISRHDIIEQFNKRLERVAVATVAAEELLYCSWPETFGSSCGPFPGIGGQACTTFRMEAWAWDQWAIVFTCGRVVKFAEFYIQADYKRRRWTP
jgi:hypothetical protein